MNCFLPHRQAAIGGVPPAISGACVRAAGADAALLELLALAAVQSSIACQSR